MDNIECIPAPFTPKYSSYTAETLFLWNNSLMTLLSKLVPGIHTLAFTLCLVIPFLDGRYLIALYSSRVPRRLPSKNPGSPGHDSVDRPRGAGSWEGNHLPPPKRQTKEGNWVYLILKPQIVHWWGKWRAESPQPSVLCPFCMVFPLHCTLLHHNPQFHAPYTSHHLHIARIS